MPTAKIHVTEGQYDEPRLTKVCEAVQSALRDVLKVPADDFYQIIYDLPRNRFLHTPSFLGLHYTDDFILLELTFISGRPKETRLARTDCCWSAQSHTGRFRLSRYSEIG